MAKKFGPLDILKRGLVVGTQVGKTYPSQVPNVGTTINVPIPQKTGAKASQLPSFVEFPTQELASKYGFDAGDFLADVCSELSLKHGYNKHVVNHRHLLRDCLLEFVVPVLRPPQEVEILETHHNPGTCRAGADKTLYFSDFQLHFVGSSLVPLSEDVLNITLISGWIDLRAVLRV